MVSVMSSTGADEGIAAAVTAAAEEDELANGAGAGNPVTLAAPTAMPVERVRVTTAVAVGMNWVEMDWFRRGQSVTEGAQERTVCMLVEYMVSVTTSTGAGDEALMAWAPTAEARGTPEPMGWPLG